MKTTIKITIAAIILMIVGLVIDTIQNGRLDIDMSYSGTLYLVFTNDWLRIYINIHLKKYATNTHIGGVLENYLILVEITDWIIRNSFEYSDFSLSSWNDNKKPGESINS